MNLSSMFKYISFIVLNEVFHRVIDQVVAKPKQLMPIGSILRSNENLNLQITEPEITEFSYNDLYNYTENSNRSPLHRNGLKKKKKKRLKKRKNHFTETGDIEINKERKKKNKKIHKRKFVKTFLRDGGYNSVEKDKKRKPLDIIVHIKMDEINT